MLTSTTPASVPNLIEAPFEPGDVVLEAPKTDNPLAALIDDVSRRISGCGRSRILEQLTAAGFELARTKQQANDLTQSLLGEVQDALRSQDLVSDLTVEIRERQERIDNQAETIKDYQKENAELRRKTWAAGGLSPRDLDEAADAFKGIVDIATACAMTSGDPVGFGRKLDAAGVIGPNALLSLSARFRKAASALRRAGR